MTPKTIALLTDPHPNSHIVFPYNDESSFGDAVGLFTAAGITQGETVVLVTTEEHRKTIERKLVDEGFDVTELIREGQLITYDAGGLLCDFFQNDTPDPDTFRRVLGKIIERARSHSASGKVRVYGEMVNLLCGHNNVDAAAHLEDLWNEVIEAQSVPLLCSYSLSMLPPHTAGTLPARIVDAHTHTLVA
jgi:hypothetical protein